ncbi:restriction endonuclease [Verrucomicrobia bacterium]|nr:restriction endonuclease [Verrucomicrobiota bacterium]
MKSFDYTFDDLINPCLKAFHNLGGSGTNNEVEEEVVQILKLSDEETSVIHRGTTTKLCYRLYWARNYLKKDGILENSSRGVWSMTDAGKKLDSVDEKKLVRRVYALNRAKQPAALIEAEESAQDEVEELQWQEEIINTIKEIEPSAFERLSQRLLRELGFNNVVVTGQAHDGGIDGIGSLSIGSVVSFKVVFQCKRYKDSVSSSAVRDFRGAVQGRADKGLILTTGNFTRSAKAEAQRDGALAIDLIDGKELAQKLKNLGLGVEVELVEKVTINKDWFQNI